MLKNVSDSITVYGGDENISNALLIASKNSFYWKLQRELRLRRPVHFYRKSEIPRYESSVILEGSSLIVAE